MKIITITGTKGKTTITRVLSAIINKQGENTLRVDTDGHYINEKQKSTLGESKEIFGLVPTVCPGKFLWEMKKYHPDCTAILEAAIGSSRRGGLGYAFHNIGIFTNVLEDHLGVTGRLKKRIDLAKAKSFIFSAIKAKGSLVFNADDKRVCSQLKKIPHDFQGTILPTGLNFKGFEISKHLENKGEIITIEDEKVVIKSLRKRKKVVSLNDIYWTFGGKYKPSIYNLMMIVGGLYSYYNKNIPGKVIEDLINLKLDHEGGRLTTLRNKNNVTVIVDYAHEKYSLREIGIISKELSANKRNIGVIRLAPDRTDKMIFETGQFIAQEFDKVIVYDKIDGIIRKKYLGRGNIPNRAPGDVSRILTRGIKSGSGKVERIIVEDKAIKRASELARPGDSVVVICGDEHGKTINSVKKYFKAKFC